MLDPRSRTIVALAAIAWWALAASSTAAADECQNRGQLDTLYCYDNNDLVADVPSDISVGSDGAIWFAGSNVGRMTTDGKVWTIPLPPQWYGTLYSVVQHTNGTVWVTHQSGIGRLAVTPRP